LFTISRKYDSLSRDNDSDSQMFMKMRIKILVFRSLMLCSRLLMNLMSAHISHTFSWLSLMKIDFFRVMILWSWRSFADSRWAKRRCHSLYNLKLLSFAKLSWSWSTSTSFSWWITLVWDAEWSRFIESSRFIELCVAENADEMSRCIADSNANSSRSFAILSRHLRILKSQSSAFLACRACTNLYRQSFLADLSHTFFFQKEDSLQA